MSIGERLERFFQWLVVSSQDPKRASLTIKAALIALVPITLHAIDTACGLGVVCLGVDETGLNATIEQISAIVLGVTTLIALLGSAYGFVRKIVATIDGKNKIVKTWK